MNDNKAFDEIKRNLIEETKQRFIESYEDNKYRDNVTYYALCYCVLAHRPLDITVEQLYNILK